MHTPLDYFFDEMPLFMVYHYVFAIFSFALLKSAIKCSTTRAAGSVTLQPITNVGADAQRQRADRATVTGYR